MKFKQVFTSIGLFIRIVATLHIAFSWLPFWWDICNFIAARGPGISEPRGDPGHLAYVLSKDGVFAQQKAENCAFASNYGTS